MINPKTQHFMADRMGATRNHTAVDHSPMYTEPTSGGQHHFGSCGSDSFAIG